MPIAIPLMFRIEYAEFLLILRKAILKKFFIILVGCWLLVAGCWVLGAGCWLLVAGCWLLVAHFQFSYQYYLVSEN
jgi:hypothetical protein